MAEIFVNRNKLVEEYKIKCNCLIPLFIRNMIITELQSNMLDHI